MVITTCDTVFFPVLLGLGLATLRGEFTYLLRLGNVALIEVKVNPLNWHACMSTITRRNNKLMED